MSFIYTFDQVTVEKAPAFQSYITKNFAPGGQTMLEQNSVSIITSVELTPEQQTELETLVRAYVDPAMFYQFDHTETMTGFSQCTNGDTLTDVDSFIFPSKFLPNGDNAQSDGTVFDAIKSILKITMDDVSQAADFTSGSITTQLYDDTRGFVVCTETTDITSIMQQWKTDALASQTGPVTKYKCFMLSGLWSKSTDYDCIWVLRLSVSDPRIQVRINGFQKLYYMII